MTGIKYDLSDQDPDESTKVQNRESPQPGMYVATILEVNPKDSKSGGGPILEVVFEVSDADKAKNKQFVGSRLWWYAMLPGHDSWEDTAWKLDQLLQALGVATKRKRKGSFDPDKYVGEELLINVRKGKDQSGDYRGEVAAVLSYDEDEWESGDDEEEDEVVYDEDDVELEEEEEEEGDDEENPYEEMNLTTLRKEARSRGMKVAGVEKDDLVEMLTDDDGENEEEEEEEEEEEAEEEEEDDEEEVEEEEEEETPKPRRKKTAAKKSTARKKATAKKTTAKKSTAKRGGTRGGRKRSGFPFDE